MTHCVESFSKEDLDTLKTEFGKMYYGPGPRVTLYICDGNKSVEIYHDTHCRYLVKFYGSESVDHIEQTIGECIQTIRKKEKEFFVCMDKMNSFIDIIKSGLMDIGKCKGMLAHMPLDFIEMFVDEEKNNIVNFRPFRQKAYFIDKCGVAYVETVINNENAHKMLEFIGDSIK